MDVFFCFFFPEAVCPLSGGERSAPRSPQSSDIYSPTVFNHSAFRAEEKFHRVR